ncbi:MAG: tRNA lysidine(34) synthetase TilS [bacterium]|nr:tRNA lysidine(34) synthetase TilS [bacterium]
MRENTADRSEIPPGGVMESAAMLQKIRAWVSEFHMIEPGEAVIAGVSGGADSVCLFDLLLALKEEIPFSFSVVHVNHGIRGDAGEDAEYVRRLCLENGIGFTLVEENVPAYAAEHRIGEEEAGRRLRYRAFARVNEHMYGGRAKIAVAHNRNDRAETVLFQLFRGSGLHGMCGIKPVQGNVIRPLLGVTREEIEAYLAGRGLSYRTDATNGADEYARNRIRHHILGYAEQEICRGSTEHINRTADMLTQAAAYLDAKTEEAYRACVEKEPCREHAEEETYRACVTGELCRECETGKASREHATDAEEAGGSTAYAGSLLLSAAAFARLHPYLQGSLVHRCLGELTPAAKDITGVHVESVCALFDKQTGRMLSLPYGLTAERTYQGVRLGRRGNTEADGEKFCADKPEGTDGREPWTDRQVELTGECGEVRFGGRLFRFRVFSCEGNEDIFQAIPKNNCNKWFDYDRIKKPVVIRYRRTGDHLAINAAGGTKSLKKYMIDAKIPADKRQHIPLIAQEDHILWVAGYRASEAYRVTADTKRIMEIYMSGGKENV